MTSVLVMVACLIVLLCELNRAATMVRYDNYHVYKVVLEKSQQLQTLHELVATTNGIIPLRHTNFIDTPEYVAVAPHKLAHFFDMLTWTNISYKLVETNLQTEFDASHNRRRRIASLDWTDYSTLREIYNWMEMLVKEHPEHVEAIVGGRTYEGRKIRGVKVSYKKNNPVVLLESNIHAREWITAATTTFLLNELLTSKNLTIRDMAENYDWYIFPVTNPDGYVHTHKTDRLWRKNRRPHNRFCVGTDLNRNWDIHWAEATEISRKPCNISYGGKKPFSEVETMTFSEFLKTLKGQIKVYLAFHAFSQRIVFPFGYTDERAPNHNDLLAIGEAAAGSLGQRYGTKYQVGSIYETMYQVSGTSIDWVYAVLDVPLTFAYELRPQEDVRKGFELPPDQIIPTGEETVDSIVTLLKESRRLGYFDGS